MNSRGFCIGYKAASAWANEGPVARKKDRTARGGGGERDESTLKHLLCSRHKLVLAGAPMPRVLAIIRFFEFTRGKHIYMHIHVRYISGAYCTRRRCTDNAIQNAWRTGNYNLFRTVGTLAISLIETRFHRELGNRWLETPTVSTLDSYFFLFLLKNYAFFIYIQTHFRIFRNNDDLKEFFSFQPWCICFFLRVVRFWQKTKNFVRVMGAWMKIELWNIRRIVFRVIDEKYFSTKRLHSDDVEFVGTKSSRRRRDSFSSWLSVRCTASLSRTATCVRFERNSSAIKQPVAESLHAAARHRVTQLKIHFCIVVRGFVPQRAKYRGWKKKSRDLSYCNWRLHQQECPCRCSTRIIDLSLVMFKASNSGLSLVTT